MAPISLEMNNTLTVPLPISLEMTNTLTDCDKGYIDVRCAFNSNQLGENIKISLIRSKEIVSCALYDGVICGSELTNRPGVIVNSSISNVSLSYLSIRIMSSVVKPAIDEGLYQCAVDGFDRNNGIISYNTSLKMLNITGNIKMKSCV